MAAKSDRESAIPSCPEIRRAGGGGRGPLRNSGKIQERRYFFLGLFHWTGDYQAVRAVAGQVAVGAFPAYFAAGAGYPEKLIGQNAVEVANDTARGGRRRCAAIAVAKDRLYSHGLRRFDFLHRIGNKQEL